MNRYITTILLLLVFSANLTAQSLVNDNNKTTAGVKIGVNMPRMYYTNPNLKDLPHDFVIGPSVGAFIEFPLSMRLHLATEFNFQRRGSATSYIYEQDYHVNYEIESYYMSLRIPFYFYFPKATKTRSYIFLGPDAGYALGGSISLSQPGLDISESHVNINDKNYNPLYLGVLAGVGMRHDVVLTNWICVIKYDVALNFGFIDTFSQSEHDGTATATNVHAYNHHGERQSRGLELSVSIGVMRHYDMSACRGFE